MHCTEVRFASFLSSESTTAIVLNPSERKLAKCTSVHRTRMTIFMKADLNYVQGKECFFRD